MADKEVHPSMQRIYDQTGLNANSLADAINEASQRVYNWDKRGISKNGAMAVSDKFGFNLKWILSGEGEVRALSQSQSQNDKSQFQSASDPRLFTQLDKNFRLAHIKFTKPSGNRPTIKIPVYRDVKAACGSGFENFLEDPSDYIEMEPMVLELLGIYSKPENLKIIFSVEDSMYPTVPHDKPLFIDVSDKDPSAIKPGGIYVLTHAYACRMKRIFMGFDGNGNTRSIRLASDNPDKNLFPDEWITHEQLNEINFIGRLVWTGKEL